MSHLFDVCLRPPRLPAHAEVFDGLCAEIDVSSDGVVSVPQVDIEGRAVDVVDRIKLGVDIVRRAG